MKYQEFNQSYLFCYFCTNRYSYCKTRAADPVYTFYVNVFPCKMRVVRLLRLYGNLDKFACVDMHYWFIGRVLESHSICLSSTVDGAMRVMGGGNRRESWHRLLQQNNRTTIADLDFEWGAGLSLGLHEIHIATVPSSTAKKKRNRQDNGGHWGSAYLSLRILWVRCFRQFHGRISLWTSLLFNSPVLSSIWVVIGHFYHLPISSFPFLWFFLSC